MPPSMQTSWRSITKTHRAPIRSTATKLFRSDLSSSSTMMCIRVLRSMSSSRQDSTTTRKKPTHIPRWEYRHSISPKTHITARPNPPSRAERKALRENPELQPKCSTQSEPQSQILPETQCNGVEPICFGPRIRCTGIPAHGKVMSPNRRGENTYG